MSKDVVQPSDLSLSAGCICPLGDQACPLVMEVERLRAECRRLAELSRTDPLTGVYNYRHLMEVLEQEMERTRRTGLATAVMMIDLDYFKRVNDRYGHQAGDEVLRWACRLWQRAVRRLDVLCRYGGEEFTLVLPATRLPQAVKIAERLQQAMADYPLEYEGQEIKVTASIGAEVYRGEPGVSAGTLLKRADDWLMQAKARGRNRVCHGEQPERGTDVSVAERAALFAPAPEEEPQSPAVARGGGGAA